MKSLITFLSDLRALGVLLSLDGERLICNAPKGGVIADLRRELTERKPEIIAFLRESTSLDPAAAQVVALEDLPLSRSQQRLWFLTQVDPFNPVYNMVVGLRLTGILHRDVLERALAFLVERHESLRTSFYERDGKPFAKISESDGWRAAFVDLSALSNQKAENDARRMARDEARKPFALENGPLFRATLWSTGRESHLLLLVIHHIVADGWSLGILAREIGALYGAFVQGQHSALDEIVFQYRDYVRWEQEIGEKAADEQMPFWLERLRGPLPILELALDRRRPPIQTFAGKRVAMSIEPTLAEQIRTLCRTAGVTPYMLLLAAFKVLLGRYTGLEDILVGSGTSNRQLKQVAPLVGFFVNNLVMRTDLSGNPSFRDLLARVKDTATSAYAHQEVPFDRLVEKIHPNRGLSHGPLVQVIFTFQNLPLESIKLPGLKVNVEQIEPGISRADLSVEVWPDGDGYRCDFEYSTDILNEVTVRAMQSHYMNILVAAIADPSVPIRLVPLLSSRERHRQLVEWNQTTREYPVKTVHEVFEDCARTSPDALALKGAFEFVTYRKLDQTANAIAHYLLGLRLSRHSFVAVCAPGNPLGIAAFIGVLKAGLAYLPVDADEPLERLKGMLDEAGASALLFTGCLIKLFEGVDIAHLTALDGFSTSAADHAPKMVVELDDPAYLMFTSGSTGKPKGVVIPHRGIIRLVKNAGYMQWASDDVVLQVSPLSFDASTFDIWGALLNGACLVLLKSGRRDPGEIIFAIEKYGVTMAAFTAALFHFLIEQHLGQLRSLRQLGSGGDVLSTEHVAQLRRDLPHLRLMNFYGPTENTVNTCFHTITERSFDGGSIPIGRPVANTQVFILDEFQQPVPPGVRGELYTAGDGLSLGYLNAPTLTDEKFVNIEFEELGSVRAYRTGDFARYRTDGEIEFLGRVDKQIKLRGYRIELAEVEQALLSLPGVRAATASVCTWPDGDRRLVAYVVPADGLDRDPQKLRHALHKLLPSHQVPGNVLIISELPRTSNGKIDYEALHALPLDFGQDRETIRQPTTEVELKIAAIFVELLKIETVSVDDDFFALGGHSLMVMQLLSRISAAFHLKLPVANVFQNSTVAELASEIESILAASPPMADYPATYPRVAAEHPLSNSQRRLWFLDQLDPGSAVYNMAGALAINGPIRPQLLDQSLKALVDRHESLRTRFLQRDGVPYALVEDAPSWRIDFIDFSTLPPEEQADETLKLIQRTSSRSFSLEQGELLRATLLRKSASEHTLVLVMHHIISDAWSLGILAQEMGSIYQALLEGKPFPLRSMQFQYRDFVDWEQRESKRSRYSDMRYWRGQLSGELPVLELPRDYPRPSVQTFRGNRVSMDISPELINRLQRLGRDLNATLFMVTFAAFNIFLRFYSNQQDILVGTPTAGRLGSEFEGIIGFFVNNLVLRTSLDGDPTIAELIQRVQRTSLEAFEHQNVPFDQLVEELQPERSLERSPIFQVMFALQNAPLPPLRMGDLAMKPLEVENLRARYDLTVDIYDLEGEYRCNFEFNADIFAESTVRQMQQHYFRLLETVVSNPKLRISQLSLLSATERRQIVEDWNCTEMPAHPHKTLLAWFHAQAELTPAATALVMGDQSMTYLELEAQSDRLAGVLRSCGVARETVVAIYLERSPEMVVGLLGIMKAGGAYLPIDPALPAQRIDYLISDAAVSLILTQSELRGTVATFGVPLLVIDEVGSTKEIAGTEQTIVAEPRSEDLAYLIYTSGSTGNPKGTEITHGALVNLLASMVREPGLSSTDTLVAVTTLSFDIAALEIFGPLVCGAKLVLASREEAIDPESLTKLLQKSDASVMQATPSSWGMLVESGWMGKANLRIWCGGEPLAVELAESLLARGRELWNLYGPTETTIWSAVHRVRNGENPILVGRPIRNTRIYILNSDGQPVPVGVVGELYIGGDGVARAYWKRPELTDAHFLPDHLDCRSGRRMYRTGDLAKFRHDGQIQIVGRADQQIKLRGYRIEPGEIEAAIERHPDVRQAIVMVQGDGAARHLVAFVKLSQSETMTEDLRPWLRERLPEYMVPSEFFARSEIPMTPNGKVDRKQLVQETGIVHDNSLADIRPRNSVEESLAKIWREVLGRDRVSVCDNFFDLGGHSLLLIRVHARIRHELDANVAVVDLFRYPTIESMASWLDRRRSELTVTAGVSS